MYEQKKRMKQINTNTVLFVIFISSIYSEFTIYLLKYSFIHAEMYCLKYTKIREKKRERNKNTGAAVIITSNL